MRMTVLRSRPSQLKKERGWRSPGICADGRGRDRGTAKDLVGVRGEESATESEWRWYPAETRPPETGDAKETV